MWTATYEEQTDLTPAELWSVLADVARWPEIDRNIERLDIAQAPAEGVEFRLKPRGGPMLTFRIGQFRAPHRYSDICRMPLARMETIHELIEGARTTVRVSIEIRGPLARLWGILVGRTHYAGLPAQTARMITRARELRPSGR